MTINNYGFDFKKKKKKTAVILMYFFFIFFFLVLRPIVLATNLFFLNCLSLLRKGNEDKIQPYFHLSR
jgi:hypothetical protein